MTEIDFNNPLIEEVLLDHNWCQDFVNNSVIYEYYANDDYTNGSRWEIWPVKDDTENSLLASITDAKTRIQCALLIQHQNRWHEILSLLNEYRDREACLLFVQDLIQIDTTTVKLQKWHHGKTYRLDVHKHNTERIFSPIYENTPRDSFDFYLAARVESQITILQEHFSAVMERLIAFNDHHGKSSTNDHTIREFFHRNYDTEILLDRNGNIINILVGQYGDNWILEELKVINAFIECDSYLVLQDDGHMFCKVAYHHDHVDYYLESLEGFDEYAS